MIKDKIPQHKVEMTEGEREIITEYQRCIVHQVRNTVKYVADKERKSFAADLKTIYQASDEKSGAKARDRVTEKWSSKYPNAMKSWTVNWDAITP